MRNLILDFCLCFVNLLSDEISVDDDLAVLESHHLETLLLLCRWLVYFFYRIGILCIQHLPGLLLDGRSLEPAVLGVYRRCFLCFGDWLLEVLLESDVLDVGRFRGGQMVRTVIRYFIQAARPSLVQ